MYEFICASRLAVSKVPRGDPVRTSLLWQRLKTFPILVS